MKYFRLNYDWNGYNKGYKFQTDSSGNIYVWTEMLLSKEHIELLTLSGALTEVEEEKVPELPEEMLHINRATYTAPDVQMFSKINEIIRYLKHKE